MLSQQFEVSLHSHGGVGVGSDVVGRILGAGGVGDKAGCIVNSSIGGVVNSSIGGVVKIGGFSPEPPDPPRPPGPSVGGTKPVPLPPLLCASVITKIGRGGSFLGVVGMIRVQHLALRCRHLEKGGRKGRRDTMRGYANTVESFSPGAEHDRVVVSFYLPPKPPRMRKREGSVQGRGRLGVPR